MPEPIDLSSPAPFLDPDFLIDASEPRPRVNWVWYGGLVFLIITILSSASSTLGPEARGLALVVFAGLMVAAMSAMRFAVREHRKAQTQVETIEELVKLRQWDQAAMATQIFLSQPTRSPIVRVQALFFLALLLSRFHRFDDAIHLQTYLLDLGVNDSMGFDLRLGRCMAMLQEDHLLDADKAISDLRKRSDDQSGALALLEIYRDVKTGHPAEAIEIFNEKLPFMRRQLGHRISDAYALLAKAFDIQGKTTEAASAFAKATLLSPVSELTRRYSELKSLTEKYSPTLAPAEAA